MYLHIVHMNLFQLTRLMRGIGVCYVLNILEMLMSLSRFERFKPLNITPVLISPLTSYTRVKAASNERHT